MHQLEVLEEKNWDNFCHYQLGDWQGTWTFYSNEGEPLKSFQCIRSLRASSSTFEKVEHNNHYFEDGKHHKTETFGPYIRPKMRGTYLNNSFSWGTKNLEDNLFFETGFRHKNQRASLVAIYEQGLLEQIITIVENLEEFAPFPALSLANPSEFQGNSQSITPELVISDEIALNWNPLPDNLMISFPDNISLACPKQLTPDLKFDLIVDWLATPTLLYRGIRSFNASIFKHFTLQTFTKN